jgi:hypothetical protein
MKLESLRIAQVLKIGAQLSSGELARVPAGGLFLDSCQRYLWVFSAAMAERESFRGQELFEGIEAYRFLLRVATGLESQILGETDIFGQLKTAFKKAEHLDAGLSFWLQKIFEDAKEIRSRHLENAGGASYGSLVRKHFEGNLGGITLLVGAGALGASIAPYLLASESLLIANRSPEKARILAEQLNADSSTSSSRAVSPVSMEDREAWASADRVIFCIPADSNDSTDRRRWLGAHCAVLHLGCLRAEAGAWAQVPGAAFLDDLFRLQKALGDIRSLQIAAAERGCDERAKLRGLGTSVSIAHGWEDLAVFA